MTQSRQLIGQANADLRSFASNAGISQTALLANIPKTPDPGPSAPGVRDREILITAEGGIFLNPQRGHISYLRNIQILDPRFNLSAVGHLRVFFPPQDLTQAIKKSQDSQGASTTSPAQGERAQPEKTFSEIVDPYLFVVSGGVRLELKASSGTEPGTIATGETVVIDRRTGDIVLQGGTPTVRRGLSSLTAGEPNLYLRIYQNGDVYAEEGSWTTTGNLASEGGRRKTLSPTDPDAGEKSSVVEKAITVSCQGGLYLNASEGQIVYLDQILVLHPNFKVEAEDEVKIFFNRKEDTPPSPEAFSDVQHIVASGAVRLVQKTTDISNPPLTATAEHAIVDVENANIILKGGTPFLGAGDNFLRAGAPDLYMRLYENGSLFAESGPWITAGALSESKEGQEPESITVTCEGGLHFDAVKGQVTYLGEIVVQEPRFRLRCDNSNCRGGRRR